MDKLDYTPEEREPSSAQSTTSKVSSRILDMMDIKGEVSEKNPMVNPCGAYPKDEDLYIMYHTWSIRGVPNATLKKGWEGLRENLPSNGWKILRDEKRNNKVRSPVIHAENKKVQHAVDISWDRGESDGKPQIVVDVVSACFKVPEGSDRHS